MKKLKNAVVVAGTYMQEGQEKKRYMTVGALLENDKGELSLRLDAIPTGHEWGGWINFFEPKAN